MEGLNQHLEFQVKLAGGGSGGGGGGQPSSSQNRSSAMPHFVGEVPDDVPDIGGMIPIEKAD